MRIFWFLGCVVLLAGCQSPTKPDSASVSATPRTGVPAAAAVVPEDVPLENTKAALEARDLLLKSGQQHQLLAKSAFRAESGFTVSNWSGIVLTPKDLKQGVVVGSGYKIDRVEIHPLTDGRLRVWVEVVNLTQGWLRPEGACEFRPAADKSFLSFKSLPTVAPQAKIVVFFESVHPQVEGYSILLRDKR
jgi:hypothetical protein